MTWSEKQPDLRNRDIVGSSCHFRESTWRSLLHTQVCIDFEQRWNFVDNRLAIYDFSWIDGVWYMLRPRKGTSFVLFIIESGKFHALNVWWNILKGIWWKVSGRSILSGHFWQKNNQRYLLQFKWNMSLGKFKWNTGNSREPNRKRRRKTDICDVLTVENHQELPWRKVKNF